MAGYFYNMKKIIFYLAALVILFSACTGRRYGHYGYVKKQPEKVSQKITAGQKQNIAGCEALPLKQPSPAMYKGTEGISTFDVKQPEKIKYRQDKDIQLKTHTYTKKQDKAPATPRTDPQLPNRTADASFVLALLTIGSFIAIYMFGGFLLWLFFLAMAIATIVTSIIALSEISRGRDMYNNRWKAFFALATGILAILLFVFVALLFIFFLFAFL